jgi:hypothetical protein
MTRAKPLRTGRLHALARFIQFRSELAILAVLGLGIAAGAAARRVLSVSPGPSAVIAAPDPAAVPTGAKRPAARPAEGRSPTSPQVVD